MSSMAAHNTVWRKFLGHISGMDRNLGETPQPPRVEEMEWAVQGGQGSQSLQAEYRTGDSNTERELWRFTEDPLQSLAECRSVHDSLKPQKNLYEELKRKIPKDQGSLGIVCTPTNQLGKTLQFKGQQIEQGLANYCPWPVFIFNFNGNNNHTR